MRISYLLAGVGVACATLTVGARLEPAAADPIGIEQTPGVIPVEASTKEPVYAGTPTPVTVEMGPGEYHPSDHVSVVAYVEEAGDPFRFGVQRARKPIGTFRASKIKRDQYGKARTEPVSILVPTGSEGKTLLIQARGHSKDGGDVFTPERSYLIRKK